MNKASIISSLALAGMIFLEDMQFHPEVFDKYYTADLVPTPGSNANTHHNPNGERILNKRTGSLKLINGTLVTQGIVFDKELDLLAQPASLQESKRTLAGKQPVMAVHYGHEAESPLVHRCRTALARLGHGMILD